jgi:hypothetical protein
LEVTGEFDLARTAPPDRTLAISDERAPHRPECVDQVSPPGEQIISAPREDQDR